MDFKENNGLLDQLVDRCPCTAQRKLSMRLAKGRGRAFESRRVHFLFAFAKSIGKTKKPRATRFIVHKSLRTDFSPLSNVFDENRIELAKMILWLPLEALDVLWRK